MKKISILIVMLAIFLVAGVGSASAQCSNVIFSSTHSAREVSKTFTLSVSLSAPPGTPSEPWANYTNATLDLPENLTNTTKPLFVNLSNQTTGTYNWEVNSSQTGIYNISVNMSETNNTCTENVEVNVGNITNPDVQLTILSIGNVYKNVPKEMIINVTNTGQEEATDVQVFLNIPSVGLNVTAEQTISNLTVNETQQLTFSLTATENNDFQITAKSDLKDAEGDEMPDLESAPINFTGLGKISGLANSWEIVQQSFVMNETTTFNSTVGVALEIKAKQNSTEDIVITRRSDVDDITNGTEPSDRTLSSGNFVDISMNDSFENPVTGKINYPATITIEYNSSEFENSTYGINKETLRMYAWNGTEWKELDHVDVDTSTNTVTANTTHFSLFGLFGDENPAPPAAPGGGGSSGGSGGGIPSCKDSNYNFGAWSTCTEGGQQSRTATKTGTCLGASSKTETRSCNFVPPTPQCTANDFECSDWNACGVDGTQARTCSKKTKCEGGGSAVTSQSCEFTPPEAGELLGGGLSGFFVGRIELASLSGKAGDSVQFAVDEENHTLTIQEVGNDSVVVWLESEIVRVELKVGESKAVNLNEDPNNDVIVKLVSLEDGVATISVDQLGGAGTGSLAVGAVVLIVLILAGLLLYKRKPKKK